MLNYIGYQRHNFCAAFVFYTCYNFISGRQSSRPCGYVHRYAVVTQTRRVSNPEARATTLQEMYVQCACDTKKQAGRSPPSSFQKKHGSCPARLHTRLVSWKKLVRKIIDSALSTQVCQVPIGDCIYCRLPTRCTP